LNSNPFIVRPHRFGRGLFAAESIRVGASVLRFCGPLIDFTRSQNPRFACYCVQVGPNSYTVTWAPERFINHSCDPNLGFQDERTLRALRVIRLGEELTFDYSTSMAENSWTMQCGCGSPQCRQLISDFVDLPEEVRARYRSLGIVPAWLSEGFERQQIQVRHGGLIPYPHGGNGNGNGNGKGNGNGHGNGHDHGRSGFTAGSNSCTL